MAEDLGDRAAGIVLTGMGDDGAEGLLAMRQAGGYTIAEDESTAVVNGMPESARGIGAACASLPLESIGAAIRRLATPTSQEVCT
jgi:two-component system chemotaxis response regulator CheB